MRHYKFYVSICALVLCFTTSIQVFAVYPDEKVSNSDEVFFSGDTYSRCEEFEDIYLSGDQYVMKVTTPEENILIPVEKVAVPFTDDVAANEFMNRDDIPQEAKDSFLKKYQSYIAAPESYDVIPAMIYFEPAVATRSGSGTPDKIIHYTHTNGAPMMTYQFFFVNSSTGWKNVQKGTSTKDKTSVIYNISLSIASLGKVKVLSYFSAGQTILSAFLSYYGLTTNSVTANSQDYFQARLVWDQTEQYTMADHGNGWQTGLVTYKITDRKSVV